MTRKITPKRQRTMERNKVLTESRHAVIFTRDLYKCVFCGSKVGIQDHHALTRNSHADVVLLASLRFTLCHRCHASALINTRWASGMLICIGKERYGYEYDDSTMWYIDELIKYLSERPTQTILVPAPEIAALGKKLRPDATFCCVPFYQIQ